MSEQVITQPQQVISVPEPALSIIKLHNTEDSIQVKDMNYLFNYKRAPKPDGVLSNYFILTYKEESHANWSVCKTMLSNEFTVAITEEVIKEIQRNLQAQIAEENHYRSGTSVKSSFILSNIQFDFPQDNDIDIIVFKLITSIDSGTQMLSRANLSFNVINGFSGNHSLQLNYGVKKNLTYLDQTVTINNIFILDEFTKRLIHDERMNVITFEELSNIQTQISSKIALFKGTAVTDVFLSKLDEVVSKKFAKRFETFYQSLPAEYRNMYYLSFILSALLETEKNIALEIKLRSFVAEYIRQVQKAALAAATVTPA